MAVDSPAEGETKDAIKGKGPEITRDFRIMSTVENMEILLDLKIPRDSKTKMIKAVRDRVTQALLEMTPPLDSDRDIVRLSRYAGSARHIELVYEIVRDARTRKEDQNRSPYREKGFIMQVEKNR